MKTKQSFLAFVVLILAMLACQSPTLPGQQTSAQPTVIAPVEAVAPIESNAVNTAVEQGGLVAWYENVNPGTVAIITDQ